MALFVDNFLLDLDEVDNLLADLRNKYWVTSRENGINTEIVVNKFNYMAITRKREYAIISIPKLSFLDFNAIPIWLIIAFLLIDFTWGLGIIFWFIIMVYSYLSYNNYIKKRDEVKQIVKAHEFLTKNKNVTTSAKKKTSSN